jgi:hypothetical protein
MAIIKNTKTNAARMQGERKSLLVAKQISATSMEDNMEVPQETKSEPGTGGSCL